MGLVFSTASEIVILHVQFFTGRILPQAPLNCVRTRQISADQLMCRRKRIAEGMACRMQPPWWQGKGGKITHEKVQAQNRATQGTGQTKNTQTQGSLQWNSSVPIWKV